MIREYILISATTLAIFLEKRPNWVVPSYETVYSWADGRPVRVYDTRLIDSMELRGWNDIKVRYPLNLNDSNEVHIVHLHDSDIVNN